VRCGRGSCGASDPAAGEGTTNPADLDNDSGDDDEDDEAGENAAMIVTDRMSCNLAVGCRDRLLDDDHL
jgi:hypothetical protein